MAHHVRAHHDVSETVSTQVRARLGGYEHKRSRQTSNKTVAEMNTTPTPLVKPRMKKVARKSGPKAPKKGSRNACVAVTKKEEQCVMLGGTETNLEADSIASRNGVRGEDANVELLEMLSDLLSNDEPSFYEGSEPSPSMPMETSEDPLENGLVFLAPGADDVTDAEMASLAQMHVQGAGLAMSGSMESQVTSLGSFLLP